jgi:hypothetical protein
LEGEQPVDDWDNHVAYHTIKDIQHLIGLTNDRIETDKGTTKPGSPESSHLFSDEDDGTFHYYDSNASAWHRLLKADGDSLSGALDFSDYAAQNVGSISMSGDVDLQSNDLLDGVTKVWDSVNSHVPQSVLERDSLTVTAGDHLSGGGSVALGGSVTLNLSDGPGSGVDADTLDGLHAEDVGVDIEDSGAVVVEPSTGINFTGHLDVLDDGDGTVSIDPTHTHSLSEVTDFSSDSQNIYVQSSEPSSPSTNDLWIDTA